MITGRACGKIILLGEHFVVHGAPAIAAGISNHCEVGLTKADANSFIGPKGTNPELSRKSISNIIDAMRLTGAYSVTYGGDLPIYGGLGSSAAFCVAIVRALADEYGLKLTNEQINTYAYEGEKAFHGNPSGIDNTLATYGGIMRYARGATPAESKFEPIIAAKPFYVVIGFTGLYGPTAVMIAKVNEFKEKNPKEFESMMENARRIVKDAESAIANSDLVALGKLMDKNQEMLSIIGVSLDVNNKLIATMRSAGALGAKLTGGGGGGCCIALAKDAQHAEQILIAIKNSAFDGFCTEVK